LHLAWDRRIAREISHAAQGRRIQHRPDGVPGVWKWQFRIGEEIKTGRTETRINLLAMRRGPLRIDRELKSAQRETAG